MKLKMTLIILCCLSANVLNSQNNPPVGPYDYLIMSAPSTYVPVVPFANPNCVTTNCNVLCDGAFEEISNTWNFGGNGQTCDLFDSFNWVALHRPDGDNTTFTIFDATNNTIVCSNPPVVTTPDAPDRQNLFGTNFFNADTWDGTFNGNNHYLHFSQRELLIPQNQNCTNYILPYNEGFAQAFQSPLLPSTQYVIKFQHSYEYLQANNVGPILNPSFQYFLDPNPNTCELFGVSDSYLPTANSQVFNYTAPLNGAVNNNLFPWSENTVLFTTPPGIAHEAIYFSPSTENYIPQGESSAYFFQFLDDLCITPTSENPMTAMAELDECEKIVTFDVVLDYPGPNTAPIVLSLNVQHEVTPGVWVNANNAINIDVANSDFDANGNLTIFNGTLNDAGTTFTLEFDWTNGNALQDENYGIQLIVSDLSPTGCICHPPHVETLADLEVCCEVIDPDFTDFTVNGLQVWNQPSIIVDGTIIVSTNATLEINSSTVEFTVGSGIIVLPGGTLNVLNSTLTSHCEDFWSGIELRGNANLQQQTNFQAFLKLASSEVSNALVGVRGQGSIGGEDVSAWSGGYGALTSSFFLNNVNDIRVVDYVSPFAPHQMKIRNCRFEIDSDFFDTQLPGDRVYIRNIHRLRMTRCAFNNLEPDFLNETELIAVHAQSASFQLRCSPNNDSPCPVMPKISGFTRGVYSIGMHPSDQNFNTIDRVEFSNHGNVYMTSMRRANITRSEFYNLPTGYFSNNMEINGGGSFALFSYGVYLEGSINFNLMENHFDMTENGIDANGYGFIADNCGQQNNWVYKNTFEDMVVGMLAWDNNREFGNNPNNLGLRFDCNTFINNDNDALISTQDANPSANFGIKVIQGINTLSATNNFSQSDGISDVLVNGNMANAGIVHNYFYLNGEIDLAEMFNTNNFQVFSDSECQDLVFLQPNNLNKNGEIEAYNTQKVLWNQIVDGGDTESLTTEVILSDYSEALDLYYELMSKSPDLSDQVMIAAIQKEYELPKVLLTEILASNPQAAKSKKVQDKLNERLDPLEEYQKDMINTGLQWVSYKEQLEGQMAHHYSMAKYAEFAAIDSINADSTILDISGEMLSQMNPPINFSDFIDRIQIHDSRGEYSESDNYINELAYQLDLNQYELSEIQNLETLRPILHDVIESDVSGLNQGQIDQLFILSQSQEGYVRTTARSILLSLGLVDPIERLDVDVSDRSMELVTSDQDKVDTSILIYPNPASNFAIIKGNLNEERLEVKVINLLGQEISSLLWNNREAVIDLKEFSSGVYQVQVLNGSQLIKTLHLVVHE